MELRIENMTCGGCARSVTKAIQSVDPKAEIATDPDARRVSLRTTASQPDILSVLEEAGYPATTSA